MKISNCNKSTVGRPSLPSIVAVKGAKHKSINFSQSLARVHNLQPGQKVDMINIDGKLYISFGTGIYNIRAKKNGTGGKIISLTCSSQYMVDTLLNSANEEKKCTYLVSAVSIDYKGSKYYMLIDRPLNIW